LPCKARSSPTRVFDRALSHEVHGTASAFCYHFGTILGGLVPPTITYLAVDRGMGFPEPMLYGTIIGAVIAVVALILSPETKGMRFTSEVQVK